MRILNDRQREPSVITIGGWIKTGGTFHESPAEIQSASRIGGRRHVDFLPRILPHVADDEVAGSVTGGFVYRGAIPAIRGVYFYGDFCAGFVRSFRAVGGQATEQTEWPLLNVGANGLTSFGEDAQGELYVTTQGGTIFKIVTN